MPKEIIKMEAVKCFLTRFKDNKMEYCSRITKIDANFMVKKTYL